MGRLTCSEAIESRPRRWQPSGTVICTVRALVYWPESEYIVLSNDRAINIVAVAVAAYLFCGHLDLHQGDRGVSRRVVSIRY